MERDAGFVVCARGGGRRHVCLRVVELDDLNDEEYNLSTWRWFISAGDKRRRGRVDVSAEVLPDPTAVDDAVSWAVVDEVLADAAAAGVDATRNEERAPLVCPGSVVDRCRRCS